jgi:hypothetical protein
MKLTNGEVQVNHSPTTPTGANLRQQSSQTDAREVYLLWEAHLGTDLPFLVAVCLGIILLVR